MISVKNKGDFKNTEKLLKQSFGENYIQILDKYGQQGMKALSQDTPIDTGLTAASWSYEIVKRKGGISIIWKNSHVEQGWANIAILLQYGHGTRNGGYVSGINYINPALKPIFDNMADAAWKEVIGL